MFDIDAFVSSPTLEALLTATRDDLVRVAGHYKLEVRGSPGKAELQEKLTADLRGLGVLGDASPDAPEAGKTIPSPGPTSTKTALEWKRLELREKELDWEREKNVLEADRQNLRDHDRREQELRLKDMEYTQALRLKEMELKARESGVLLRPDHFDVTRNIRVVPPFREDEVDKFFAHFERVATTLKWPKEAWPMTLQCVFVGKAQEAYSSLSLEDAADYEKVKQAVLLIYALVPEAYRQKFRSYRKPDSLAYVEFVREKEMLFDRWLGSQEVTSFQALRDLMVLEDFKNCLPQSVATHISEHKDLTPASAAVLADEYVLTHKRMPAFTESPQNVSISPRFRVSDCAAPSPEMRAPLGFRGTPTCSYCKKRGHVLAECFSLKRKNQAQQHASSRFSESDL